MSPVCVDAGWRRYIYSADGKWESQRPLLPPGPVFRASKKQGGKKTGALCDKAYKTKAFPRESSRRAAARRWLRSRVTRRPGHVALSSRQGRKPPQESRGISALSVSMRKRTLSRIDKALFVQNCVAFLCNPSKHYFMHEMQRLCSVLFIKFSLNARFSRQ